MSGARVVLYNKNQEIPLCMQDYKHKLVHLNDKWVREGLLGICDKCGEYKELISLSDEENLCDTCTTYD